MNKIWSGLRRACSAAGLAAAALAMATAASPARADDPLGVLPEAASAEAGRVDDLIYLIIWLTVGTFVGVQLVMLWFLVRYRARPGVKAKHTHGNHTVEMVWTVAPAAILVFLAVYQMGLWTELRSPTPSDNAGAVPVRIYAKQFEWNFRYPGPDGKYDTPDDLHSSKTLVVPVNRPVNGELRAMDVIHSFFLPNFRFKLDAVPGLTGRIWFRPEKFSADRRPLRAADGTEVKLEYFDIVCAELCGSQHTTMAARLYVVTDEEFARWQKGEEVTLKGGTKIPRPTPFADIQPPYDFIWSTWARQDDPRVTTPPKWHRRPFHADGDYKGEEE